MSQLNNNALIVGALFAMFKCAIARLGGKHTTNLQIPLDEDVTIGGRSFKKGTLLNTGLDVPARSLLPLGMRRPSIGQGKLRVGITCALCHASVDNRTGRGHNYWVDAESGFTIQDQSDLIEFLLSLDDNPEVLTASSR